MRYGRIRHRAGVVCRDTVPAVPGDPAFSYLGKFVKDLTLAQVKTLDCGPRRHADPTTEDIDDFGGSLVPAVQSFGADAISPVHGDPQGGSSLDRGYRPFTTKEMVHEAHAAGMKVIPWTVNDIATMDRLIDIGVDGIITDYPDRLRDLLETCGYQLPRRFGRS